MKASLDTIINVKIIICTKPIFKPIQKEAKMLPHLRENKLFNFLFLTGMAYSKGNYHEIEFQEIKSLLFRRSKKQSGDQMFKQYCNIFQEIER